MHEKMLLARHFDERMFSLQRQGRLGTFAPVKGQEAAQIGAVAALNDSDWIVPAFREVAAYVWRGLPLEGLLLYNAGYNEGGRVPDGEHFLPIAIPVGSQMLHAAGLAYGLKLQKKREITMTFFGDGATSEGDFHEAMNFAMVYSCPMVFICQNNHYAISVPRSKQTTSRTLAQKAFAYDMPCLQVDGNDVLAVYTAAKEAVERARKHKLPTLIECVTYRLSVHTTVDDPSKYRTQKEVEEWEKRDPIPRFQRYLKQKKILSDADAKKTEERVEQEIAKGVEAWQGQVARLTDPSVMFDHLYAEMPPSLRAQRESFAQEWTQRSKEASHG
jgi:pyruvate dehydrogenase E1 component alpha subunit